MPERITPKQIARMRLQTQALMGSEFHDPAGVAGHMLAMQAQDFGAVQWALAARAPGSNAGDVDKAFDSGRVIRSWPMRGTLHVMAAEDLRWMLYLTSTRTLNGIRTRHAELGWDDRVLTKAEKIAYKRLSGKHDVSRSKFVEMMHREGIEMDNSRAYRIIWYLAQRGVVCWGPRLGAQQALVLYDEWVPKQRVLDTDEALAEIALRYFASHGPATLKDLTWWSKITTSDARRGLSAARKFLVELECEGVVHWAAVKDYEQFSSQKRAQAPSVLALSAFDEHLLGYGDRSHVLPNAHATRVVPGGNGMFLSTIVVDGVVAGTWKRSVSKKTLTVTPAPFKPLTAASRKRLVSSLESYAEFCGLPNVVVL